MSAGGLTGGTETGGGGGGVENPANEKGLHYSSQRQTRSQ